MALMVSLSGFSQVTWDNFEDERRGEYGFINGVFIPYTGNPDPSGANTSAVCATYVRNPAEQFDVILIGGEMANVGDYVSGTKQMSIDVWSPAAGITVQITLENAEQASGAPFPQGRHSIYLTQTTVAEQWETLTFTFNELLDGGVGFDDCNSLVLLFNPNSNTDQTFFWDNLNGPELDNDPCPVIAEDPGVLMDFECQQNLNFISASNGVSLRRLANPDPNGNTSDFVGTYVRGGNADDFVLATKDAPLELNPNSTELKMDVWDPTAPTIITFSLQNANGDIIQELVAATMESETWETLTFLIQPEVTESPDIERFTLLFDFGSEIAGDQYYFDNITIPSLTSTEDTEYLAGLKAYPNPTTDVFTLEYNLLESSDVNMSLTDITGRVVENKQFSNLPTGTFRTDFDTNGLADGVYLYNVRVGNKNHTGKIIVSQ